MKVDRGLRGHKGKLEKQGVERLDIRKYFFTQQVVDPWNSLPSEVVEKEEINPFKNALDRAWINHPLKYEPVNLSLGEVG